MPTFGNHLAAAQDGLLTRRQALAQLSPGELDVRLGREWRVALPGVYVTSTAPLSRRQQRRAALLKAGEAAILTDLDALDIYGVPGLPADPFVRVLVPIDVQRASRDFMSVLRSARMPRARQLNGFSVAPPERALADFIRRCEDERTCLAVASAAVQRQLISLAVLAQEAEEGPARGRPRLVRVRDKVSAGVRSVPEADFRALVQRSKVLPEPLWNPLLKLPDGQHISPDALFEDAGLVHETNGRAHHAGEDTFEDMQRRHDVMVVAGLVVLHNSPRRLDREGLTVLAQTEDCYLRHAGRGMPPGIEIVRRAAAT